MYLGQTMYCGVDRKSARHGGRDRTLLPETWLGYLVERRCVDRQAGARCARFPLLFSLEKTMAILDALTGGAGSALSERARRARIHVTEDTRVSQ